MRIQANFTKKDWEEVNKIAAEEPRKILYKGLEQSKKTIKPRDLSYIQ